MALTKKNKWYYGDSQEDIREEIKIYSEKLGFPSTQYADAVCECGCKVFQVKSDRVAGVAVRDCRDCGESHPIGDSGDYLEGSDPFICVCPCGEEWFETTIGINLYKNSENVRWLFLGLRCVACGITAGYGDWKNEFLGYRKLLENV